MILSERQKGGGISFIWSFFGTRTSAIDQFKLRLQCLRKMREAFISY